MIIYKDYYSTLESYEVTTTDKKVPYSGYLFFDGSVSSWNHTWNIYVNDKRVGCTYADANSSATIYVNKGDNLRADKGCIGAMWNKSTGLIES